MSDTFTGSNGETVTRYENGDLAAGSPPLILTPIGVVTLREFFLHERDSDLRRWRWPENPQYVVYPSELYLTPPNADLVTVVNERNGQSSRCRREDDGSLGHFSLAAAAYFAAHPEPRPWHDAKPGEVWAITTENVADEVAVQRTDTGDWQYCDGLTYRDHELKIETARRIWPEVSP